MKAVLACATVVTLFALGGTGAALAAGECSQNSNKPCPDQENTFSKEPAYKSPNTNKPTSQRATDTSAPTSVQPRASEGTAAKGTLSGVSASDLKLKPKPAPGSEKEPAK